MRLKNFCNTTPRTQFHIGLDFGVSESSVCRIIGKVETLLVQSGHFRLPGKRQLQQPDSDWEVVVMDVTEVAVERPQENNGSTTVRQKRGE